MRRGAAAVLALVAGGVCGIALILSTATRRAELVDGIDGSLVVSAGRGAERGCVCFCAPSVLVHEGPRGQSVARLVSISSRPLRALQLALTLCACAGGLHAAGRRCAVRQNLDQLGLSRGQGRPDAQKGPCHQV